MLVGLALYDSLCFHFDLSSLLSLTDWLAGCTSISYGEKRKSDLHTTGVGKWKSGGGVFCLIPTMSLSVGICVQEEGSEKERSRADTFHLSQLSLVCT